MAAVRLQRVSGQGICLRDSCAMRIDGFGHDSLDGALPGHHVLPLSAVYELCIIPLNTLIGP
jgi:hypothetical protein